MTVDEETGGYVERIIPRIDSGAAGVLVWNKEVSTCLGLILGYF